MKNISILFVLLVTIVSFDSCKKAEVDTETQSAVDNATCEAEFMSLPANVNNKAVTKGGAGDGIKIIGNTLLADTPQMSVDSVSSSLGQPTYYNGKRYPRKLIIDYGSGILGVDKKTRKGIVSFWVNKPWVDDGSGLVTYPVTGKVTLYNYSVDDVSYSASSITIRRDQATEHTISVVGGECWNNSWHIYWDCVRTINVTLDGSDNIESTSVYGTATGKNQNQKSYEVYVNASTPIVKFTDCKWPQSGVVEITPEGKNVRTLDYGNTGCDNDASLTIKGNKFNFKL